MENGPKPPFVAYRSWNKAKSMLLKVRLVLGISPHFDFYLPPLLADYKSDHGVNSANTFLLIFVLCYESIPEW